MVVWNDSGSAIVPIGGSYTLGAPYFHHHPLWNITSGVYGESYEIQIKFHDGTGTYTDSEPVTILFAPACPGDVNLSATVDVDDLLGVINGWGECPDFCQDDCPADFDETCEVDVDDLLTVINGWGDCNQ
jgi:hypothetical protein